LTYKEAVEVIKSNYPPEQYTMFREALDLAIRVLESKSEKVNPRGRETITNKYF